MNLVIIMGTITRELEVKYTAGGSAIINFGIAYNERYKDKQGQQVDKAMFFDVTAFGKQGETINQYFHKGSRILIEGSLDFQTWTAADATKRSKVSIKLNRFTFVDKKSEGEPNVRTDTSRYKEQGTQIGEVQTQSGAIPVVMEGGEIPFSPLKVW